MRLVVGATALQAADREGYRARQIILAFPRGTQKMRSRQPRPGQFLVSMILFFSCATNGSACRV
jgi:hypothetical protein